MADPVPVPEALPEFRDRWPSRAGPWLGLGASPGALLIGATIANRHGGPAPILSVVVGVGLMALLLWTGGRPGLAPPAGEGATLHELAPRYFDRPTRTAISVLVTAGMVGWVGFLMGLGGAALSALVHLPSSVGPLVLGGATAVIALRGLSGWNRLAAVTTFTALALVVLVVIRLAARSVPVSADVGPFGLLVSDWAGFVGYVAVFSLRAPDFTACLAGRRDLAWCVGLLCVPMAAVSLAGVALQRGTGTTDLVGALARPGGLAAGNFLVAAAVVAPALASIHSGGFAVAAATRLHERTGMLFVSVAGIVLAVLRFDRRLSTWLAILAATLPPLIVPMAVEAARRRRGALPRRLPPWTWAPASAVAVLLTVAGRTFAPLVGLTVAVVLTVLWCLPRSRREGR